MPASSSEQILGIHFFNGAPAEAVEKLSRDGGLLVAPSGTCFDRFTKDEEYRTAIMSADVVLPDSGAMVLLWRFLHGRRIRRISGLAYLHALFRTPPTDIGHFFWVLPHERAREKLIAWSSNTWTAPVRADDCYLAPFYGPHVEDRKLADLLEARRPRHVVIAIGAGAQEKLGWYLRAQLSFRPAISCIGGALGFITGDQVAIPPWADRLYLGWFLRLLRNPRVFIPRLWQARVLPWLIWRYGSEKPELKR